MSFTPPPNTSRVRLRNINVLSDDWYVLRKVEFDYLGNDGEWSIQQREAYDRGNGATILLVDWDRGTVLLTRQFRLPALLNGHDNGMLVEAPAGLLDGDNPVDAIRRETEEETGYRPRQLRQIFELFMSPGSVTERVAYFVGEYQTDDLIHRGGGVANEGEDIEVIEISLDEAIRQAHSGDIVDGKTVLLLLWAELELTRRAAGSITSRPRT